jgi:hypothetical protein
MKRNDCECGGLSLKTMAEIPKVAFSSCMSESDQHIHILNKRTVRVQAARVAQEVGSPALRCENARDGRGGTLSVASCLTFKTRR